ncbi:MAG: RhuM family protein [Clostridia bacterium]
MQKMHITKSDKLITLYSLDAIISLGYRVKSKEGTKFRIWANKILKDYMLKGYVVNQRRLEYLEKTIKLIDIATRLDEQLRSDESYNMLKIISEYTKALETLDKYDHNEIDKPKGNMDLSKKICYNDCIKVINQMPFKQDSDIIGVEREQGTKNYNLN